MVEGPDFDGSFVVLACRGERARRCGMLHRERVTAMDDTEPGWPPVILLYFQAGTAGVHPWNETRKQGKVLVREKPDDSPRWQVTHATSANCKIPKRTHRRPNMGAP